MENPPGDLGVLQLKEKLQRGWRWKFGNSSVQFKEEGKWIRMFGEPKSLWESRDAHQDTDYGMSFP